MNRLAQFQLVGPLLVFVALLSAEAGAFALAHDPTSAWLWYLNLHVFSLFQQGHYVLDGLTGIPASSLLFVAVPSLGLAYFGFAQRRRLPLALGSNLSLVYALFLVFSWKLTHPPHLGPSAHASLQPTVMPTGPDLYLLALLFAGTLLSAWISHVLYVRSFRDRA
jgi:hypothetical protein